MQIEKGPADAQVRRVDQSVRENVFLADRPELVPRAVKIRPLRETAVERLGEVRIVEEIAPKEGIVRGEMVQS